MSFIGFGISLILSLVGAQLRAHSNLSHSALPFLRRWSWLLTVCEACMFLSAASVMKATGSFIHITYIDPSTYNCPGGSYPSGSEYSPCGDLGNDLFQQAEDECGESKENIIRVTQDKYAWRNIMCMSLDVYNWYFKDSGHELSDAIKQKKDHSTSRYKVYFGWSLDDFYSGKNGIASSNDVSYATFDNQGVASPSIGKVDIPNIDQKAYMHYMGTAMGGALCGKFKLQDAAATACKGGTSPDCASVLLAYNTADKCAGEKGDEIQKCFRLCEWITIPFYGTTSVMYACKPIPWILHGLSYFIYVLMVLRIIAYVALRSHRPAQQHCCTVAPEEEEEIDDEDNSGLLPQEG
eukprot:gnl/MRDRNA2_/MRDRNA2_33489_c0_seq1.p1 gnl/MRDRNA2_/MRDRNA2_33489_c0~~gnl/MRDRNA2_/MRDRNA2_33489_c0_seq1.p1  ORF type:complete len:390 (+),score=41.24 gnl/MRDRNA2_/MRDRNA2_33489_c0_seq1:119-1171(+)